MYNMKREMYWPRIIAFNAENSSAGFSTIWKQEMEEEEKEFGKQFLEQL
jgi:hypothetical protein